LPETQIRNHERNKKGRDALHQGGANVFVGVPRSGVVLRKKVQVPKAKKKNKTKRAKYLAKGTTAGDNNTTSGKKNGCS